MRNAIWIGSPIEQNGFPISLIIWNRGPMESSGVVCGPGEFCLVLLDRVGCGRFGCIAQVPSAIHCLSIHACPSSHVSPSIRVCPTVICDDKGIMVDLYAFVPELSQHTLPPKRIYQGTINPHVIQRRSWHTHTKPYHQNHPSGGASALYPLPTTKTCPHS